MNTTQSLSEDDDLRLAEYALGVLDADQRQFVETQLASAPEYAQRLTEWHERLAPMLEEITDEAPPAYAWARIRDSLGHVHPRALVAEPQPTSTIWSSLALWRGFSAAGLAAALIMAVLLVVMLPAEDGMQPAGTMLTAALQLDNGEMVYTATLDASRRSLIVVPVGDIALDGRAAELWLISGDLPPQSLGLLPVDGAVRLAVPVELGKLANASSVFAISLEPPGGSPTGLPTGPVVAQGALADI